MAAPNGVPFGDILGAASLPRSGRTARTLERGGAAFTNGEWMITIA
jgi:hypothetical protein